MSATESGVELWESFAQQHGLDEHCVDLFKMYYHELIKYNELFNLTAITQLKSVLAYHLSDSLALGRCRDVNSVQCLIDVGSGAGFPAFPLKIQFPHLSVVAIEVNNKKADFLEHIAHALGFSDVIVSRYDWRTFLRKTHYCADLVLARASLDVEELVRVFRPSSPYKNAQLVYWASKEWQEHDQYRELIRDVCVYSVGRRTRKLVFFGSKPPVHEGI